ncbi:MAG: class I SAM-dependent DNA methyltransferase [Promicromonosporaceae bacterium]|nr:class I SAM-dependent DNA methyltransferase [Promicromonosporaceae bacterium]
MATSDAFLIGRDWISEHFFVSDSRQSFEARALARRKIWDEEAKEESAASSSEKTTRTRFLALREQYLATLATLSDQPIADRTTILGALYGRLVAALGYQSGALDKIRNGPATFISAVGLTDIPQLVIIEAQAVSDVDELLTKERLSSRNRSAHTLLEPFVIDEKDTITSVSKLLSYLFVAENGPEFALVLAGAWALITDKQKWPEGRFLAINLQLVAERADDKRGGETDRAITCLDAASLAPDAEGRQWWAGVLNDSIRHTQGVSKDLREGVRSSIEVIANEVVSRRAKAGLPPLPQIQAQLLARQALRYLYRILFLLFAEASPELGVLPVGDPVYELGYSLDRLRELTLVEIAEPAELAGTHLYDSLATLFRLVDVGHHPHAPADSERIELPGLKFDALRADLFLPRATSLIDEVGLGNGALQQVLAQLLLSKEAKGKDRGFISYAELGINQLGAVYEGLMSYSGFFAEEELHEVAKDGNSEKGSWVIPATRSAHLAAKDFVKRADPHTGELKPVVHERDRFVFRLAGRERQQSASYYTPEVLTRFTVSQALAELLDPVVDGEATVTSAREILDLTICEPALGSGAFAIEAVRQLASEYLVRRQAELDTRIDPDKYGAELQKVKAYLALHNVYGVDLNATAVELAEISLWLDTMGEGMAAPWFGLHLRRGTSLIGARRATFSRAEVSGKKYLGKESVIPRDIPLGKPVTGIHHFLVPADGWGSAVDAKEAKLAEKAVSALKSWRKQVLAKPSKGQVAALVELANRVEVLWAFTVKRLRIAEEQIRRPISVWGADGLPVGGAVTREQIEAALSDSRLAYGRLRRVMDAWCAMWFWPLSSDDDDAPLPPNLDQWIEGLQAILGVPYRSSRDLKSGIATFAQQEDWTGLEESIHLDLSFAGAKEPEVFLEEHPWLKITERIAQEQGFFHWELDFAALFADRGGFDLQVGNPPWVRPRSDVEALLAEGDPWWQLKSKSTAAEDQRHRATALAVPGIEQLVLNATAEVACQAAFLGSKAQYPFSAGLQPDLYRCFMQQTWRHARRPDLMAPVKKCDVGLETTAPTSGVIALIHPETHFTDEKAGNLRAATYRRLRRHWQFINELQLFEEIHHLVSYGIHVYSTENQETYHFLQATSLYHPDTVERSFLHDGSGGQPGLKDDGGNWDTRPHRDRVTKVDEAVLKTWHDVLEPAEVPNEQTRMVYTVNKVAADVLAKLAQAPRIGELGIEFSAGWHEKNDRTKGYFDSAWGESPTWKDVILQGPNLHIGNPFFKFPNPTMKHNQDWTAVDLEALPPDAIPVTSYKPTYVIDPVNPPKTKAQYDAAYTHWEIKEPTTPVINPDGETEPDSTAVEYAETTVPARDYYRVAWRMMAASTGERTLIPAIIPPGSTHIHGISAIGEPMTGGIIPVIAGTFSALLSDFLLRATPSAVISFKTVLRTPRVEDAEIARKIMRRALRLNCLTSAYAELWQECTGTGWTPDVPLRNDAERRQALVEIDALVALALGVTIDELVTIYRTQFPVLRSYDNGTSSSNDYVFDANGRLVPTTVRQAWKAKGDELTVEERTATHTGRGLNYTYEFPFARKDREADLRAAYAKFAKSH